MDPHVEPPGQVYKSHADFYRAVYAGAITGTRAGGNMGGTIMQAQQPAGDWSDAATPDLVVAVMTSDPVKVTMDLGAGQFTRVQPKNSFILISPQVATKVLMDGAIKMQCLSIPYGRLLSKMEERDLPSDGDFGILHTGTVQDGPIAKLVEAYWRDAVVDGSKGRIAADVILLEMAGRLLELRDKRRLESKAAVPPLAGWRLRRAKEYLEGHLCGEVSIEALAKSVCLSPNYFITSFRRATGHPPHKYLLNLRIKRAGELLRDPKRSISNVAWECGFQTSQRFATVFREEVGRTPSAYRQEVLDG